MNVDRRKVKRQHGRDVMEMTPGDFDAVLATEAQVHAQPWTRGQFQDSFSAGHSMWIMRKAGVMVGYAVTMAVVDEVHLLNISVPADSQGHGHGSALLSYMIEQAWQEDAKRVLLEVRPSNVAALALYARCGFKEIGRRRSYYATFNGREDAIVMARELS